MEPIIEVKNLVKVFHSRGRKITAVNDVSFDVFNGEIFGMIGPNGAGKSTTFSMLTTLLKPTGGSIKVAGFDVQKQDDKIRPLIGIVPQKLSLYPLLTARENLEFMGSLYNLPKNVLEDKIDHYLKLVGLEASADRYTGGFSGGMKQRLSVIAAVLHDPQILFWDEPSTGLDPQTRNVIWKLGRRFNEEGRTLVFTTHYMEEADNLCNRVAVMDSGKMVALDDPERLKETTGSTNLEEVFVHFTGEQVRD